MGTPIKYHTEEERRLARNAAGRKHYYKDLETSRKQARDWIRSLSLEERRARAKRRNRRKRGLLPEEYNTKLVTQNGVCALCKRPFDLSRKRTSPVLDHNHTTGENRDFLHSNCNVAIGLLLDGPRDLSACCRIPRTT